MDLILLGGNSPKNQEWIEKVEESLKSLFSTTTIQYYDHWIGKTESLNPETEIEKLKEWTNYKKDYAVFAKSAGVGIVAKAIEMNLISPKLCIFVGTASNWKASHYFDIEKLKANLTMPILFIQQTEDKYIHFEELREIIKGLGLKSYKMIEVEGSDHVYGDLENLKKLIEEFLKEKGY